MARPTRRRPLGAAVAALLFALALLPAGGCAKKITTLDPSKRPPVYPEGLPANAKLMLYEDTPIRRVEWADLGLPGVTPEDTLISSTDVYDSNPGVIQGSIVDFSNASAFDIFREESNGGFDQLFSVPLRPLKSWLVGQAELYRFQDPAPVASHSYQGRGEIHGVVNAQSPLTNVAQLTLAQVAGDLRYVANTADHNGPDGIPVSTSPNDTTLDSLFTMRWLPVPGATAYWISVVGLTDGYLQGPSLIKSGLPRPVFPERFPEYFVGYIPSAVAALRNPDTLSYTLAQRDTMGSRTLEFNTTITGVTYAVRIVAIDPEGQVLNYTRDDPQKAAFAFQRTNTSYVIFPLGYVIVKPTRVLPPAPGPTRLTVARRGLGGQLRPGQTMMVTSAQLRAAFKQ
jgi:hypothetical protein